MAEEQAAEFDWSQYTPEQIAEYQAAYAAYYYGADASAYAAQQGAEQPASGKGKNGSAAAMVSAYAYGSMSGVSSNPLMQRPARKQATTVQKSAVAEGDRNIWWGYTVGDYSRKHSSSIPAETRCLPSKDTGYTKGSLNHPATALFCIHFAKGCCIKGEECSFLHRVPEVADELRWEQTKDCFGRDKHEAERDDKSGTGSFVSSNRTLYVGHVPMTYKDVEAVVRKHFGEFGELESVRVLTGKSVAFIRYKSRLCAEFAREAMVGQTLDGKSKGKEILNVRWANEDPNPKAQEAAKQSEYRKLLERLQTEQAMYGQHSAGASFGYMTSYSAEPVYNAAAITDGGDGGAGSAETAVKRKRVEVEVIADPENPEETEIAEVTEYEPEQKADGGTFNDGSNVNKQGKDPYQYPDTSAQIEVAAAPADKEAASSIEEPAPKKAKKAVVEAPATPVPAVTAAPTTTVTAGGILSKDALEALAKNAGKLAQRKGGEVKKTSALSMVGGYDSEEEE